MEATEINKQIDDLQRVRVKTSVNQIMQEQHGLSILGQESESNSKQLFQPKADENLFKKKIKRKKQMLTDHRV